MIIVLPPFKMALSESLWYGVVYTLIIPNVVLANKYFHTRPYVPVIKCGKGDGYLLHDVLGEHSHLLGTGHPRSLVQVRNDSIHFI